MRGGHQTSWLIDGVPIPDTNIGTSIGPRIAPGDIDETEIRRGSYNAQYGDRTYGEFNILPKTGFDRNNEGELAVTLGNPLPDRRPDQFRQPYTEARLLRERKRQSQQLWSGAADTADLSRCGERLRRIYLLDL